MMQAKKMRHHNYFAETWRALARNKMAMLGLFVLCMLILIAIFAPWIAQHGYDDQNLEDAFTSPCLEYPLGTDNLGRDVLSRLIYGSRISLSVGFLSVLLSAICGGFLGLLAGFYGGRTDNLIMRFLDVFMAIPPILLAITIAATLGAGVTNAMIAIGLSGVPAFARIVRASVLTERDKEYIEAAYVTDASDLRIILRHLVPNILAPVIVQMTLMCATAILTCASLSFIGLGAEAPLPEWGAMLSGGRSYLRDYGYICLYPGLTIMITIFSLNMLGDGLRDALDPRLKGAR